MTQTELSLPRTIPNPFRPGTQNDRLFQRLKAGPVTNLQIIQDHHILKYTGRISEIREALRPYLMDVHAQKIKGSGVFVYSLKGGL